MSRFIELLCLSAMIVRCRVPAGRFVRLQQCNLGRVPSLCNTSATPHELQGVQTTATSQAALLTQEHKTYCTRPRQPLQSQVSSERPANDAHARFRPSHEIEIEIGTPEQTRAWTLGAVGWASRMLSARIHMRPPYAPLPLPGGPVMSRSKPSLHGHRRRRLAGRHSQHYGKGRGARYGPRAGV
jgi:hypothetical protein